MKKEGGDKNTAEESLEQHHQVTETPLSAGKTSTALAADVSGQGSSSTVAKQTMQFFPPAALSNSMDETYKTLAQHINSYFGTSVQGQEDGDQGPSQDPVSKAAPHPVHQQTGNHIPVLSPVAEAKNIDTPFASSVSGSKSEKLKSPAEVPSSDSPAAEGSSHSVPVPAPSAKKGFTQYLSYPRPSVQAFVGSYIAPLVPKFIGDSKGSSDEKGKSPVAAVQEPSVDKAKEKTDGEEEKVDKVKQQLLTQREKVQRLDCL